MVVFKSIFLKMLVGCEVGRFGVNCTLCRGCQTCDIVSGECGTWHLTEKWYAFIVFYRHFKKYMFFK